VLKVGGIPVQLSAVGEIVNQVNPLTKEEKVVIGNISSWTRENANKLNIKIPSSNEISTQLLSNVDDRKDESVLKGTEGDFLPLLKYLLLCLVLVLIHI